MGYKMARLLYLFIFIVMTGCSSQEVAQEKPAIRDKQVAGEKASDHLRSASNNKVSIYGGDGSSFEKAVIIKAPNTIVGVSAEYQWIRDNLPGWKVIGQALLNDKKKMYDRMECISSNGEKKFIYFEITSFFGKL